jgi:hypothetical protein
MASIRFGRVFRWGVPLALLPHVASFVPSVARAVPGDIWDPEPRDRATGGAAPESAATSGWWGPAINIEDDDSGNLLNVVHAAVVPYESAGAYQEGKLILFKGRQIKIFDLEAATAAGESTIEPIDDYPGFNQLIFCSGHTYLEDGRLMITGGDWGRFVGSSEVVQRLPDAASWASIYDPVGGQGGTADTVFLVDPMPGNPRYYPTSVTHRDGTILTIGGNYWTDLDGDLQEDSNEFINNDTWVEFRPNPSHPSEGYWCEIPNLIPDTLLADVELYPHLKVLPDGLLWLGRAWGASADSWFWPYAGQGTYGTPQVSPRNVAKRLSGTAVLLPFDASASPTARVLYIGGGNRTGSCSGNCDSSSVCLKYPTETTEMYDSSISTAADRWRDKEHPSSPYDSDMAYARKQPNAVILPTGDVLVVGGHRWHDLAAGCAAHYPDSIAVKQCEIFRTNETTPGFDTIGNKMAKGRLYHSFALLLPDGRVLAAGGDTPHHFASKDNYELFYPPELLEADADTARVKLSRPVIASLDREMLTYAEANRLTISMTDNEYDKFEPGAEFSVVLIRPSAVTHANNMTQRLLVLAADPIVTADSITVTVPTDPAVAPPGPYMLFVLDDTGCWSEAKWVSMTDSPYVPPTPDPDDWSGTVSMTQNVVIACTDTLTIAAGTVVNVTEPPVGDLLSLTVYGTLVLEGSNSNPITFQQGFQSDKWYGIRLGESGQIVFAPAGGNGENGTIIRDAVSPLAYEGGDLPAGVAHHMDIELSYDNDFTITFDRDYIVAVDDTLELEPGWRLGFADSDFAKFGRDPNRVEVIVHGTFLADGLTDTTRITLESTEASPDNGWFGVRFLDAPDASVSDLEYVDFRDTFYAVSLDTLSGDIKSCVFDGWTGSPGDIFLERDTRLLTGKEWKFTSSAVFRISEFSAVQPSWGVDSTRNEIYLDGILRTEGGASLTFQSAKAVPTTADWYGIRVPDFEDQLFVTNATLSHAIGGLVLENPDDRWPNLEDLVEDVTFESNLNDVTVAGDRVIEGGGTTEILTIPEGFGIGFTHRRDNTTTSGEADTQFPELIIREGGQVLAKGTSGSKVSFRSDNPVPGVPSWYGIRLQLDAVLSSGYGYCESAYSKFEYVEVSDAQFGFRLEGQDTTACAPTLDHVTFTNIQPAGPLGDEFPRHIYVDRADVHIPYGYWNGSAYVDSLATWDLEAPAYVVFSGTVLPKGDSGDLGHEGKEDLFVHGLLVTRPDAATGDSLVVFRPETAHNATGDDWGGIWVDWTGAGSRLDNADIGHAINPLFFSGADSSFVRNSRIHHYRDDAIFVDWAYVGGITIEDCRILRGTGLEEDWGLSAIRAIKSSPLIIRDNLIYDYDLNGNGWNRSATEGASIVVVNDKTWCTPNPSEMQQVLIQGNDLVGPGEGHDTFRTALDLDWPCGIANRTVTVNQNAIVQWSGAAIDMLQGIDVQVDCNRIENNFDGFLYSRNTAPLDPETRLKENYFLSSVDQTIQTDTRELLALGPDASDRGKNKIEIEPNGQGITYYYMHNDATSGDSLDARGNQWKQGSTIESDAADVRAKINGDQTVRASELITGSYDISCVPATPSSSPPAGTNRPPRIATIGNGDDGGGGADDTVALARPLRTGIERVAPSPFRGTTSVRFTVAGEAPVPVSLSVYDVTGRLVDRLVEGAQPSGWHDVAWNGRDRAGGRVGAGVYFLRFEAGGVRETRKIVYLN